MILLKRANSDLRERRRVRTACEFAHVKQHANTVRTGRTTRARTCK
jgi:hypothetical protein